MTKSIKHPEGYTYDKMVATVRNLEPLLRETQRNSNLAYQAYHEMERRITAIEKELGLRSHTTICLADLLTVPASEPVEPAEPIVPTDNTSEPEQAVSEPAIKPASQPRVPVARPAPTAPVAKPVPPIWTRHPNLSVGAVDDLGEGWTGRCVWFESYPTYVVFPPVQTRKSELTMGESILGGFYYRPTECESASGMMTVFLNRDDTSFNTNRVKQFGSARFSTIRKHLIELNGGNRILFKAKELWLHRMTELTGEA